jgi:hypothetical protein
LSRSAPSSDPRMSDKMFERIDELSTLREFNLAVERMNEEEKKNLELEYEKLTGMECDDAALIQTDEQFVETMKQAYENMNKKRDKEVKLVEIYA